MSKKRSNSKPRKSNTSPKSNSTNTSTSAPYIETIPTQDFQNANIGNATALLADTGSAIIGYVTRATFGETAGNYVEKGLDGALKGFFAFGIQGAFMGLISGIASADMEERQKKDEDFLSFISNNYDSYINRQSNLTAKGLELLNADINTLKTFDEKAAYYKGQAYHEKKKSYDNSLYSEEYQDELDAVYSARGEKEAEISREREIAIRDSVVKMMDSDEYANANDDMKYRLVEFARQKGETDFKHSALMLKETEYDKDYIELLKAWTSLNDFVIEKDDIDKALSDRYSTMMDKYVAAYQGTEAYVEEEINRLNQLNEYSLNQGIIIDDELTQGVPSKDKVTNYYNQPRNETTVNNVYNNNYNLHVPEYENPSTFAQQHAEQMIKHRKLLGKVS